MKEFISKLNPYWTIFVLGITIYFLSLFNGFVLEDKLIIVDNALIHSLSNLPQVLSLNIHNPGISNPVLGFSYKPVMFFAFLILYHFFGTNTFFYHALQLSLHIGSAIFLFLIFKDFFKKNLAFFLSLIFLVHPINTESVLYISSLQDTFFLFFGLLALVVLKSNFGRKWRDLIAISSLILSSLSKETGTLFFLILPAYQFLFNPRALKKLLVFLIGAAILYVGLKTFVAKNAFFEFMQSSVTNSSWLEKIFNFPLYIGYYLKIFLFPQQLVVSQNWIPSQLSAGEKTLRYILLTITVGTIVWVGNAIKRDEQKFKQLVFFTLIFVLGVGLHSHFFPLDLTVAQRWFYLPLVGLLGIIGLFFENANLSTRLGKWSIIFAVIIIFSLSLRTFIRTRDWADPFILYSHDNNLAPNSATLENELAVQFQDKGNLEEAKAHFQKSIHIDPKWPITRNNLGVLYIKIGDYEKAKISLNEAMRLDKSYYEAHLNYGVVLIDEKSYEEAEQFVQKSLELFPDRDRLMIELILTQTRLGKTNEAKENIQKYFQKFPDPAHKQALDSYLNTSY